MASPRMLRRQLPKLLGALFMGILVFGLSFDRGSANVDPLDQQLQAFIEAASAVDQVMATWQPKIANAELGQTEALRQEANIEIREAIDAVDGISFADYQHLRQTLATDPAMLARVKEIMHQQGQR